MMQCFGKYQGDRLCDICKKIDIDSYDKCSQIYLDEIKTKNYFKECKHYKEEKKIESCTDDWTGRDETTTIIKHMCLLSESPCVPNYRCAKYI